jgi:uncharacterized protein (TIGR03437 family)
VKLKFLAAICIVFSISVAGLAQSPTYQLFNLSVPGSIGLAAAVAADFNGDHKIDLAVATMGGAGGSGTDQVFIYLNNGDGTFQPPKSFAVGTGVFAMVGGDFNGDGKIDLITGNTQSKDISVLLGNGDGTFQSVVSYPAGGAVGGLASGDFNGDGKLDIAVVDQVPGLLSIFLGNGDGTFGAPSTQPLGMTLVGVTVADFNGDGKLDLAITDTNSTVWLLLGAGDGAFGTPQSISLTGTLEGIASGDFNGDKQVDLAVTSIDSASVYVLLGKGDGTFQAPRSLAAGRGAYAVTVGDFNSDGKLDMAVANNFEVPLQNDVSLLLGNGDGTFAAAVPLGAGNNPVSVVAADFSGDGKMDFAVANNGSPFASVLINGFPKGLSSFTTVSAADGSPGLAPESLVSAYAPGISAFGGSAGLPVPTMLAGLMINVQDSEGVSRLAPLLFASPAPSQINFQIPAGTHTGPATLTILNGTATAMVEYVTISPVAPSLFSADSSGTGPAAATAVSVSGSNVQTPVAVYQCELVCSTVPIVLSANAQVVVSLFGTGIRGAGASSVSCTIHGVNVPVEYAGPQPAFLGLDQINVALPLSLKGSGQSEVIVTADGHTSNAVLINIQ